MDWINLAHSKGKWQGLVKTLMTLKAVILLTDM
jgi:hypothetical protein